MNEPQVIRHLPLSLQVCVPSTMADAEIEAFADEAIPSGTKGGWMVRTKPDPGALVRQPCASRPGCVHVVLDA